MVYIKKFVSIATIIFTSLISLVLILLLFGVNLFGDVNLSVIITLISLSVGCFFTLNSISMINRSKILGWVSFGFIVFSVLLIILFTWIDIESTFFLNFTISIGLLSVLFNIIVSSGLQLGRRYLIFQIITYLLVFVVDLLTTLMIFSILDFERISTIFILLIILSILAIIVLKVFSKKSRGEIEENSSNYVKITKDEYQELLEKAKKYDEICQSKK